MRGLLVLAAVGGAVGYLYSKGWTPQRVKEQIARERERLPAQLKEALAAGKRAAARRERELEEELAGTLGNQAATGI